MATSSFGKTVYLTDEMADRIIEAMEEVRANPPKPHTREIKWGDEDALTKALERKFENAK
ncbi:MAG: hypothetical protein LBL54_00395 [Clostridiales Family XIII bacterium]|jgi:peptide subunit release factor 1 (eRF1)|nr:hypothetical protein [Clostridiales Family XIII bacterium]